MKIGKDIAAILSANPNLVVCPVPRLAAMIEYSRIERGKKRQPLETIEENLRSFIATHPDTFSLETVETRKRINNGGRMAQGTLTLVRILH